MEENQTVEMPTTFQWSQRSESITKLASALCKAQAMIAAVHKDSDNPFFKSKYADLAAVWDAVRGPFTSNGLCVLQEPSSENGRVILTTTVLHESGEYVRSSLNVPVGKQDAQGYGSAITYCRRYSLQSVAGVAPEDDDGNGAVGAQKPNAAPKKKEQGRGAVQTADGVPVMPGGKYAGKPMSEMPANYLQWIIDNDKPAKELCETELLRRESVEMQSAAVKVENGALKFADGDDLPDNWASQD